MGMAVSIDIRDPDAPSDAIDEVVAWLHHVDATFSTYIDDSPICRLGRGELALDDTTEEVRDVLRLCEQIRVDTDGAFDIFEVPAPNGTTLDPSGLVKGWSIELAAKMLERRGARTSASTQAATSPCGDARRSASPGESGSVTPNRPTNSPPW